MGQPCLSTSWIVTATSQIGLSFLGTNQAIMLLLKRRNVLVSVTTRISESDLRENCYDSASPHVS